jgi:hypothetical protein
VNSNACFKRTPQARGGKNNASRLRREADPANNLPRLNYSPIAAPSHRGGERFDCHDLKPQ